MARFTNKSINEALLGLRNDIRNGHITLAFRTDSQALRKAVAATLGIDGPDAFNTENFNKQTLQRFATFFAVPRQPVTSTSQIAAWRYPSTDEVAWAMQNFMNRRANPWSHVANRMEQEASRTTEPTPA